MQMALHGAMAFAVTNMIIMGSTTAVLRIPIILGSQKAGARFGAAPKLLEAPQEPMQGSLWVALAPAPSFLTCSGLPLLESTPWQCIYLWHQQRFPHALSTQEGLPGTASLGSP